MNRRGDVPVASLPRRLFGFILDGLVLLPLYFVYATVLDALLGPLVGVSPGGDALVVLAVSPGRVALELTLNLLTDAAYFAGSWWLWGTTLGQRICGVGVRVLDPARPGSAPGGLLRHAARRIPAAAATSRWAVLQLPGLCLSTLGGAGAIPILVVGALNATWLGLLFASTAADPLLRGLHDRVAGTVVVRASPGAGV